MEYLQKSEDFYRKANKEVRSRRSSVTGKKELKKGYYFLIFILLCGTLK